MAKKITQYPASSGNPEAGSVFDVSELNNGTYTSKKITLAQLLAYMNANLTFNTGVTAFKNLTGSTIIGGSLVSISGADTSVKVSKVNSKLTTLSKLYVATESITNNTIGEFIDEGVINNVNTNAFPVGTLLFWDSTNQTYTNALTSGFNVFFGVVLVQSSSAGSIYASPSIYTGDLVNGSVGQVALFQANDKVTGNSYFTFVDNIGTEIGYRIADGLNNLTQVGISYINVETEGNSQSSVLRLANWSDGTNNGLIAFRKSRGTKSSPAKVLSNDIIGTQIFSGQADKAIDEFGVVTIVRSGMTTAEIIVRAVNDYVKNYDVQFNQTISSALTQYEIWLQSSNSSNFGDFTPLNTKVFAVDGDGKVSFRNYTFPTLDGTNGQGVKTNGSGQLYWANVIEGLFSYFGSGYGEIPYANGSKSLTSSNFFTFNSSSQKLRIGNNGGQDIQVSADGIIQYRNSSIINSAEVYSDTDNPQLKLTRTRGTNSAKTNLLNNDIIAQIMLQVYGTAVVAGAEIQARATEAHNGTSLGSELLFYITTNATNVKKIGFRILNNGSVRINETYNLPSTDGTNGTSLITDGAGNVVWGTPSASASTSMQTIGRNATGATLYKGMIVYISGSTGNRPNFVKAQANSEATSAGTFGVVVSDIANNSDGYVATIGTLSSLDTRSVATNPFTTDTLADGDTLYLSPTTAGYVTNVKPSAPNHLVYIGKVTLTSPTNGTIVYRIQNGYELEELHNVAISSLANNDVLQYESATSLWKNKPLSSAIVDNWKLSPTETFRGISFNNNSTTLVLSGGIVNSTTASTQAKSVSSSSFINKVIGLGFTASVVSTGRYTGIRGSALLWYIGGGFRFTCSVNISDTAYNSGSRQFYGLGAVTTDLTYTDTILVASQLNIIGVGSDSADTNLQVFYNDGAGTASKIDLGSSFPANRTAGTAITTIYEIQLLNLPASTDVLYRVVNKETGAIATGTLSTDLPLATQGLNFFASRTMGSPLTGSGQFILTGQFGVYSAN